MYDERNDIYPAKSATGYATPRPDMDVRELEIEREVDILSKAVAELSATCGSLENLFSAVVTEQTEKLSEVGRPEQIVHTKLGNKIAQIRRTVENTQTALNYFIQRKEV